MHETEQTARALAAAGCLNVKMAQAVLDDEYGGDVAALKRNCPYLFKGVAGKTGLQPVGVPNSASYRKEQARKAAGLD